MPSLSGILVISDCDGVLVDGERLAVAIDVRAIGALGWPITQSEVIDRHLGRSSADVLADIEVHLGRQVPVDWDEAWNAEYRRVFDEQLEPAWSGRGDHGHSCFERVTREDAAHLTKTGLWDFFGGRIFSVSEVERGKPVPGLFLYAAKQVGLTPVHCVVIEDSRYGVAGAKLAGMKAIGFAGGITPAAHLEQADVVISDMTDLPGAFTRLMR
jgi:beta-phosphoglucomutase-like phosphatase (HAD superfamily)